MEVAQQDSHVLLLSLIWKHLSGTRNPSEQEREAREAVWVQVKGACEKLKEETNAQDEHMRKMLQEMADRYFSRKSQNNFCYHFVILLKHGYISI